MLLVLLPLLFYKNVRSCQVISAWTNMTVVDRSENHARA